MLLESEDQGYELKDLNGAKLLDKERREFDNVTLDNILACKDVNKLRKMEAYFRQEGFQPTAEAVRKHLQDLGHSKFTRDSVSLDADSKKELDSFVQSLRSWTAEAKVADKELQSLKGIRSGAGQLSSAPPRAAEAVKVPVGNAGDKDVKKSGGSTGATGNTIRDQGNATKPDSKFGGQVRSGSDYYKKWEKYTEKAVAELDQDTDEQPPLKADNAGSGSAKIQDVTDQAQGLSTAGARGAALTQKLIELNADMTPQERAWHSEQEKVKGNDFFRSKEYAQAVERYTLSLGYKPDNTSVYGNRAAAYFKLKMYDEVVQDCDSAIKLSPEYLKGYVRRAAAKMELNQMEDAIKDIERGLHLSPENKELQNMYDKALKASGKTNMKRMAIQEIDGDEEDATAQATGNTPQDTPPASDRNATGGSVAGSTGRRRVAVIEESDSEDNKEEDEPVTTPATSSETPATTTPATATAAAATTAHSASKQVASTSAVGGNVPATRKRIPVQVVEEDDSSDEDQAAASSVPTASPVTASTATSSTSNAQVKKETPPTVDAKVVEKPAASAVTSATTASSIPAPAAGPQAGVSEPAAVVDVPIVKSLEAEVAEIKDQGNAVFKAGNYARAAHFYSEALTLQPDNAILYQNRALCQLRVNNHRGALTDASVALSLDEHSFKAMRIRAQAKEKLGLLKAAVDDMKIAASLAEDDAKAAAELKAELNKMVSAVDRREQSRKPKDTGKVTHYKSTGVTIEEHESEDEDPDVGAKLPTSAMLKIEKDARDIALRMRKQAAAIRQQREEAMSAAAAGVSVQPSPDARPVSEPPPAPDAVKPQESVQPETSGSVRPAIETVDSLKDAGNLAYRNKAFQEAITQWERAIVAAKEQSKMDIVYACHNNIARAKLDIKDYEGALKHADAALEGNALNEKALHRRAFALRHLGRLRESLKTYSLVRQRLVVSQQIDQEMQEVIALIKEQEGVGEMQEQQQASQVSDIGVTPNDAEQSDDAEVSTKDTATHVAAEAPTATPTACAATAAVEEAPSQPAATASQRMKIPIIEANDEDSDDEQDTATSMSMQASQAPPEPAAQQDTQALRAESDAVREQGNEAFKKNDLALAIQLYRQSIAIMDNAAAHLNLALVFQKQRNLVEAEKECSASLALDPEYTKAQYRLATIYVDQGMYQKALSLLEVVSQKEKGPNVLAQITKAQQGLAAQAAKQAERQPSVRHKITIEQTESSDSEDESSSAARNRSSAVTSKPSAPAPPVNAACSNGIASTAPNTSCHATSDAAAPSSRGPSTDGSVGGNAPRRSSSSSGGVSKAQSLHEAAAAKAAAAVANLAKKRPGSPKGATDIVNACKLLANDEQVLCEYMQSIPPSSYQSIVKESLDGALLKYFFNGLSAVSKVNPGFAKEGLTELPSVSRFALVYPMLGAKEKVAVKEACNTIHAAGIDVEGLRNKYKV